MLVQVRQTVIVGGREQEIGVAVPETPQQETERLAAARLAAEARIRRARIGDSVWPRARTAASAPAVETPATADASPSPAAEAPQRLSAPAAGSLALGSVPAELAAATAPVTAGQPAALPLA